MNSTSYRNCSKGSDFECVATQVCNAFNMCDCNRDFGWTGFPNCTSLSTSTITQLSTTGLCLIIGLCLLCFSLCDARTYQTDKGTRKKNTTALAFAFAFIGNTCFVIWNVVTFSILLLPGKHESKTPFLDSQRKAPDFALIEAVSALLTGLFTIAGVLELTFMWTQVAETVSKLRRMPSSKLSLKYRVFVDFTQTTFILLVVVCSIRKRWDVILVTGMGFILVLALATAIGASKLVRLLQHEVNRDQFRTTKVLIQRTAVCVVSSLTLVFVLLPVLWTNSRTKLIPTTYVKNLLAIAIALALGAVTLYAHDNIIRSKSHFDYPREIA